MLSQIHKAKASGQHTTMTDEQTIIQQKSAFWVADPFPEEISGWHSRLGYGKNSILIEAATSLWR